MSERMTIGQFAKLTHLSVKTLRHYHDSHVLAPASVDPENGYRYYEYSQAHRAHLVRRLRAADMSLAEIAELLGEDDADDRRVRVAEHAESLAQRASELAAAADALRTALDAEVGALDIVRRELFAEPALVIVGSTDLDTVEEYCARAFLQLVDVASAAGARANGAGVAAFDDGVFESTGDVTCSLSIEQAPIDAAPSDADVSFGETPSGVFLTAVHAGDRSDVGVTYSALGRHVDQLGVGASRPVVERYLVADGDVAGLRTEVCWPVIS